MLIVSTADEHRVALAMLRIALGLSPGQVEELLGGEPGWVISWESGHGAEVTLERWRGWVQHLAVGYTARLHASATPAMLRQVSDTMGRLAERKEGR